MNMLVHVHAHSLGRWMMIELSLEIMRLESIPAAAACISRTSLKSTRETKDQVQSADFESPISEMLKCSPQKTNFPEKSFFSPEKNGFPIGIASVSRLEKAKAFAARRLPHKVSQPVSVYVPKNCFTIESPCSSPQNTCQRLFSLVTSPSVVGAAASTFNRNSILVNHAAVFIMWD